jgi:hypothetical protein
MNVDPSWGGDVAAGWAVCRHKCWSHPRVGSSRQCFADGGVGRVGSRVEPFEAIRRDRRMEDLSIRELAERHKVHRRAVRAGLASTLPPPREEYVARSRPATDPWADVTLASLWMATLSLGGSGTNRRASPSPCRTDR